MFNNDSDEIFFATGRASQCIRSRIDQFLTDKEHNVDLLQSIQGEWCFFYFKKRTGQLICGRDIFARKSLCWRISNSDKVFQISTFPGTIGENWHEVFPGTFFIFTLSTAEANSVETQTNDHIVGHTDLRFRVLTPSLKDLSVHFFSHFSREYVIENAFNRIFDTSLFTRLNSNHLLKPTNSVKIDFNESMLDLTISEFYGRFEECVRAVGIKADVLSARSARRIAVLFSGGVDSLLVGLTAGKMAPDDTEIILINVAFGNTAAEYSNAPDRQRSINAFKFLRETSRPTVLYRLVLVNVSRCELVDCRQKFISRAITPCFSVLDDSIGCVLWFATRGSGVEFLGDTKEQIPVDFSRPEDIELMLVGSGADEQLGGYARHRTLFGRFGYERLAEELAMEMARIGLRNFGRDDRIATSNGRILVAPFLEESFVEWLNKVPLNMKVNYSLPLGQGEKWLLRQALVKKCGVPTELAAQPKRAMQFGTRITKMESRREKGSDVCDWLEKPKLPSIDAVVNRFHRVKPTCN